MNMQELLHKSDFPCDTHGCKLVSNWSMCVAVAMAGVMSSAASSLTTAGSSSAANAWLDSVEM